MFRQASVKLLQKNPKQVKNWLTSFDTVITDCDGVLWISNNVIENSVETINALRDQGKRVFFCTNNSTKTRSELNLKARKMGFNIIEDEIISTAHSTAAYLKNCGFEKKVYVIGRESIAKELRAVGIDHTDVGPDVIKDTVLECFENYCELEEGVGAVVVGFDEHFSFAKMVKAATYLNNPDCLFVATNTDERFPTPKLIIPGAGSFVRAVQTCVGRDPFVIGKPNPKICEYLIKDGVIKPERTLMIGDRCNTDILLGYNCGFQTLLVGTGMHQLSDVKTWQQSNDSELKKLIPDVFLPKLGDLLPYLKNSANDC